MGPWLGELPNNLIGTLISRLSPSFETDAGVSSRPPRSALKVTKIGINSPWSVVSANPVATNCVISFGKYLREGARMRISNRATPPGGMVTSVICDGSTSPHTFIRRKVFLSLEIITGPVDASFTCMAFL